MLVASGALAISLLKEERGVDGVKWRENSLNYFFLGRLTEFFDRFRSRWPRADSSFQFERNSVQAYVIKALFVRNFSLGGFMLHRHSIPRIIVKDSFICDYFSIFSPHSFFVFTVSFFLYLIVVLRGQVRSPFPLIYLISPNKIGRTRLAWQPGNGQLSLWTFPGPKFNLFFVRQNCTRQQKKKKKRKF